MKSTLANSLGIMLVLLCGVAPRLHGQASATPTPDKVFFLRERVSIVTDSGVTGLSAGTPVQVIEKKGNTLRLRCGDNVPTFNLSRSKVTDDPVEGARLARRDDAAQQPVADFVQRQYEAQQRQEEAHQQAVADYFQRQAELQQKQERQRIAEWSVTDLVKQAEERKQQQNQDQQRAAPEQTGATETAAAVAEQQRKAITAQAEDEQAEAEDRAEEEERVESQRRQVEENKRQAKSRALSEIGEIEQKLRFNEPRSQSDLWSVRALANGVEGDVRRAKDSEVQSRYDEAQRKIREQEDRLRREEAEKR